MEIIERTSKTIRKSLHFEKSGETISIEACLENVSPQTKADVISPFLSTMFEYLLKELNFNDTSL